MPDALLLDAGGVLLLPQADIVCGALRRAGIAHRSDRLDEGHYAGVAAIDAPGLAPAGRSAAYRSAFMDVLGIKPGARLVADGLLAAAFREPAAWSRPAAGARELLQACRAASVAVAVVSNWDGTVARLLHDAGVSVSGPDGLEPIAVVIDSAVVGYEKPDPRIFQAALDALDAIPARAVHVGDSLAADVAGALAAGIEPIHLDPFARCADAAHAHARGLADVAVQIGVADGLTQLAAR